MSQSQQDSQSQLAYIGTDRQIHLANPVNGQTLQLTFPMPRSSGPWAMLGRTQEIWSWPVWSQDGQWLAAFCTESSDNQAGPVRVVALSTDGIRQTEWLTFHEGSPIYLQWHPTGNAIAVLSQVRDELVLSVVSRDRLGHARTVEAGVPLFFNWNLHGPGMLIHVGGRTGAASELGAALEPDVLDVPGEEAEVAETEAESEETESTDSGPGRLIYRDPLGTAEDIVLDRPPGSFCAPLLAPSQPVMVLKDPNGGSEVVAGLIPSDGGTSGLKTLAWRRGLLAVVAGPDPERVAIAAAAKGEGSPYRGIDILNIKTGHVRRLTDAECLAFFWSPRGDRLLYVVVDNQSSCLQWFSVALIKDDFGDTKALATFWPTRDILFYLHFFDQFNASHPLISPDGRYLTYTGYPAGAGRADLSGSPVVYLQDLDAPTMPPQEVGSGSFSVFAPGLG